MTSGAVPFGDEAEGAALRGSEMPGSWITTVAPLVFAVLLFLALAAAAVVSRGENETRAAGRLLLFAFLLPLPYVAAALVPLSGREVAAALLLFATAAGALFLFLPLGEAVRPSGGGPTERFDERDTIFSRRRLEPGSERFEAYYHAHPEKRGPDDAFRAKPGLMSARAPCFEPITFAAAEAAFDAVRAFHPMLDEPPPPRGALPFPPAELPRFLAAWAKRLGAHSVGFTELRRAHLYTHVGRGAHYGEPVALDHPHAIALTVEMEKEMIDAAPQGPTLMESAQQYLRSGTIALLLARFLQNLGYRARAHIDGSYRVVCPIVACDAGLGEIGRIGLLMTPRLGPRVRIAVVTTDLPLPSAAPIDASSMIDFCERCRKCAAVCPSRAIPFGEREETGGMRRWRIDAEACFTYWCAAGTDCARCVKVCPYAHPDNGLHRIVRGAVRRNRWFRRLAIALDDFLYGRKPPPAPFPAWLRAARGVEERRG